MRESSLQGHNAYTHYTHDTCRLLAHQEDSDESGHQLGTGGVSVCGMSVGGMSVGGMSVCGMR